MAAMINLKARERDEFLKALDEARRAALADDGEPVGRASPERLHMAAPSSCIRSTAWRGRFALTSPPACSSRLYSEGFSRPPAAEAAPEPPPPPKSEHEQVVDELHITPNLTSRDLKLIRRRFAKTNHPDRVPPPVRDQATRRMTIANSLIDEALRGAKPRPRYTVAPAPRCGPKPTRSSRP